MFWHMYFTFVKVHFSKSQNIFIAINKSRTIGYLVLLVFGGHTKCCILDISVLHLVTVDYLMYLFTKYMFWI